MMGDPTVPTRETLRQAEPELSERAEENIEAWERKRAAERAPGRREDLSDDAESGGP